jgi:D-glycero-alpha-D-manno-heptose-7-phosphate kinase
MIIVTKCPLRISLAGGSTDLQGYLDKYESGGVVSFTPDLFTYIILKKSSSKYYKVVYSKIENVLTTEEIQNDVAREVLTYFDMPPVEVMFTADIPSTGSGLASSSSYLIALIRACLEFLGKEMTREEIGHLAVKLERQFNPLTGYQDIYGCLYEGFKKISFSPTGLNSIVQMPSGLFDYYSFNLIPVGSSRSSTNILSTINLEEVHKMSSLTDLMVDALTEKDYRRVGYLIQHGWELKKNTSSNIVTKEIQELEDLIMRSQYVVACRLIGAGTGGYMLVMSEKNYSLPLANIKINLYNE